MCSRLSIRRAELPDIPLIRRMAAVVFRSTYASILSSDQMEYMMDLMYSERSLRDQVCGDGKHFFIAEWDGSPAGYASYEFERFLGDGRPLFHLQKLYVLPAYRGLGIGGAMVDVVKADILAGGHSPARVELNVNRSNPSVSFYEHLGMHRDRSGDFDIGNGYFMNDYIYAFDIT